VRSLVLPLALALAAAACAGREASAPTLTSAALPSAAAARLQGGESVPGTDAQRFVIRIARTLSTATSTAGQEFDAQVLTPLVARGGAVLVDAGAPLLGHIDAIDTGGDAPRMPLSFDAVATRRGPAVVTAAIDAACSYVVPALDLPGQSSQAGSAYERTVPQLVVPAGAEITLRLTRPLVVFPR
jgi:hypothetical protein